MSNEPTTAPAIRGSSTGVNGLAFNDGSPLFSADLVSDGVDPIKATALHEAVTLTIAAARAGLLPIDWDPAETATDVARGFEAFLREVPA